tara:strand:+ start:120 stop:1361 length:1242 start_codon:yes stop_codon:yes gene_type:complete
MISIKLSISKYCPIFFIVSIFYLSISCGCSSNDINDSLFNQISVDELRNNGLKIIIPDSSFKKIVELRNYSIKQKIISKESYFSSQLISGIDTINAQLRLKGDHIDHLIGNRWSYRIKTEGKVLNETKFSIQGLETRSFLSEWIFHKLLNHEGLVHLQYEFFPVCINDIDSLSGVYAFESHFKSDILINQNKEVGPIFKFNEDLFWDYSIKVPKGVERDSFIRLMSKIEITNSTGFSFEDADFALENLKKYINNEIYPEKVFDMKKWAQYFTINAFMSSSHALRWHNLRFYLNPNTKLLEPVGFDLSSWFLERGAWHLYQDSVESFYKPFYNSEVFNKELILMTKKMSDLNYLKNFFKKNENNLEKCQNMIQREKSNYKFNKSKLFENQYIFKESLEFFNKNTKKALKNDEKT